IVIFCYLAQEPLGFYPGAFNGPRRAMRSNDVPTLSARDAILEHIYPIPPLAPHSEALDAAVPGDLPRLQRIDHAVGEPSRCQCHIPLFGCNSPSYHLATRSAGHQGRNAVGKLRGEILEFIRRLPEKHTVAL